MELLVWGMICLIIAGVLVPREVWSMILHLSAFLFFGSIGCLLLLMWIASL